MFWQNRIFSSFYQEQANFRGFQRRSTGDRRVFPKDYLCLKRPHLDPCPNPPAELPGLDRWLSRIDSSPVELGDCGVVDLGQLNRDGQGERREGLLFP